MNPRTSNLPALLCALTALSLGAGIGGCVTDVQKNSDKATLSPSSSGANMRICLERFPR
jgi:hypothetical protein